jgi:hypothetical protein
MILLAVSAKGSLILFVENTVVIELMNDAHCKENICL